jgi:hypothetical protein
VGRRVQRLAPKNKNLYYYMTNFKEKLLNIVPSGRSGKKYMATVKNISTGKSRIIHFGASDYQQFKDSTGVGKYTKKNHGDLRRRKNYFSRHSGIPTKLKAIEKEKNLSNGNYTAKILSHIYLW